MHGGGWHSTAQTYLPGEGKELQAAGYTTFVVNYRSDSTTTAAFPGQVDDLTAATQWAIAHAAAYNGNPGRVILVGGSSGGRLADMVAEQLNAVHPGTVRTVVTLSGAFDFALMLATGNGYLRIHGGQALGCDATCSTATETQWSPDAHVTPTNCPAHWLVLNGDRELMPVDQATAMVAALQADHCPVTGVVRSGPVQSFAYWTAEQSTILAFMAQ